MSQELEKKISALETEVEGYPKAEALDQRIKNRIEKELDEIVEEVKQLESYSRINFTGFMKVYYIFDHADFQIAKKHDKLYVFSLPRIHLIVDIPGTLSVHF